MVELIIAARYNGPPGSANGGYTCGLLAEQVGEPAEVTLRSPPPLDTPLRFDGTRLWDGETLVAEAHRAHVHLEVPEPVAFDDAERASRSYPGFEQHEYATCFVCGPNRDDGLGLFAGAVDGTSVFAAPWVVPDDVSRVLVWAALDCPGAIGVGWDGRGDWLLGRMAARGARRAGAGRALRGRRAGRSATRDERASRAPRSTAATSCSPALARPGSR